MQFSEVRAKYPQSNDMSDEQLAQALHRKYYSDLPYDEFAKKVGLGGAKSAPMPQAPEDSPILTARQGQAAVSGINRAPAFLAGMPVDTVLNIEDLLKAGTGVAYGELTGKAPPDWMTPRNRANFPMSSAWLNKKLDALGVTAPSAEAEYPGTAAAATGGATALFSGRPANVGQAVAAALMGSAGGWSSSEMMRATGDSALAALAGIVVPTAASTGVIKAADATAWVGKNATAIKNAVWNKDEGARQIALNYLEQVIGKENVPVVIRMLERGIKNEKPPVHGYNATPAELLTEQDVGGSYRLTPQGNVVAALQKQVSNSRGTSNITMASRRGEQNDALLAALRTVGGTPEDLSAAQALAQANARQNYGPLMGLQVSPQSEVALTQAALMQARGVPLQVPPSARNAVVPVPPNQTVTGAPIPYGQVPPYSGRIGALQQAGQLQTEAAQQANLANRWSPVPGMPRVAGRYSPNIERVHEAEAGMREAALKAQGFRNTEEALQRILDNFATKDARANESAAPLFQRPSVEAALKYAKTLADENGYAFPKSLDDNFSVQNLHDIKLGLDAALSRGANKANPQALDNTTLSAITRTKQQFLNWLEYKVPQYGAARQAFARDMAPVNQMRVAQALEGKLLSPQGQMTPRAFISAIDDETKTIKNVTGQSRQDFGDIFTPQQRQTIGGVGGLLERRFAAENPQTPVMVGGKNIAQSEITGFPNLLWRPAMIANWILKVNTAAKGRLESKVDDLMAGYAANPEAFVAALKQLPPDVQVKVGQVFRDRGASPVNMGLLGGVMTQNQQYVNER